MQPQPYVVEQMRQCTILDVLQPIREMDLLQPLPILYWNHLCEARVLAQKFAVLRRAVPKLRIVYTHPTLTFKAPEREQAVLLPEKLVEQLHIAIVEHQLHQLKHLLQVLPIALLILLQTVKQKTQLRQQISLGQKHRAYTLPFFRLRNLLKVVQYIADVVAGGILHLILQHEHLSAIDLHLHGILGQVLLDQLPEVQRTAFLSEAECHFDCFPQAVLHQRPCDDLG